MEFINQNKTSFLMRCSYCGMSIKILRKVIFFRLQSNELVEEKMSWRDKYTTVVYSPSPNINSTRWELQPLPDYMRWLKTSELHYLPYEERAVLEQGLWDETPGIFFLPTRILDLCYFLAEDPPPDVMNLVALLAWITVPQTKNTMAW